MTKGIDQTEMAALVESLRAHEQVCRREDRLFSSSLMVEAADMIERLEAECFKLAAGVCEHRSGNDHGNPLCLKTNTLI